MACEIRVAVVDGHPLFRVGVANALRDDPGFEIVGVGASADEALQIASLQSPDVMLLDVDLPGGIAAAQSLSSDYPAMKIIMLTESENELRAGELVQAGARGYVLKDVTGFNLASTIRSINDGYMIFTARLAEHMFAGHGMFAKKPERDRSLTSLKPREAQVIHHVSRGLTNKEVAGILGLSEQTVKNHMTSIMRKLRVQSRAEAALCVSGHQSSSRH